VPISDRINVGYVGYAFLESPGNDTDGIDNDGDALYENAPRFTEADFQPRTIMPGMQIVSITEMIIDNPLYEEPQFKYERSIVTVPSDTFLFVSQGREYEIFPGYTVVEEDESDIYDNDFDGLINENYEAHYNRLVNPPENSGLDPMPALQYIDYLTGAGLDDPMIDEGRFDGIDNDGDWDPSADDLGADGSPGTGDSGEGDNNLTPGERHFDSKDVSESDQIGLTSFF
ncbi:MAG: hypothetical protein GY869_09990, partial [Planctomycetes bacterium]|nr:hypothetical protein [Planctomycetota bacterium]